MEEKFLRILQDACAFAEEITGESKINALSIDSLSFVEALVRIEEEFGIEFDIDEAAELYSSTVGEFLRLTKEKANGGL